MNKKIPVVIPYFKETEKLKKCLSALDTQSYQPIEIYVRDNSEDNILFTAAVNEGLLKYVGELDIDYILVLNQDAYVENNTINQLVRTLEENPECGIACPIQIEEGSGRISWAGSLDAYPSGVHNCTNLDALEKDLKTYWANGAAMLLRKEMIRRIGVFDENMKFVCSDSDYSFMARSRGWSVMTSAKARVFHSFSTSGNISNVAIERVKLKDMLYFSNKWLNGELYKSLAYESDKLTRLKIKTQVEKIEDGIRHLDGLIDAETTF
jgi:GT2 family glycosyltransferase